MKFVLLLALVSLSCLTTVRSQDFKKMRFNHEAILVVDLKQSTKFYMDVLKLDSIPEPFHDGKHLWLSVGNGGSVHVIEGADKAKEYFQNNHFCLSTDNVVAFTKHLELKKVAWYDAGGNLNKMTTRVDGVHQVWVKDPDGYWIEVNNAK